MKNQSRTLWICVSVSLGAVIVVSLLWNVLKDQQQLPTEEEIRQHPLVSSALVSANRIICLGAYSDIDAILFKYETETLSDDKFFQKTIEEIPDESWEHSKYDKKNGYVSFQAKTDYGELRVYKERKKKSVLVGCWMNSSDQSEFAAENLWNRVPWNAEPPKNSSERKLRSKE